jgi:hypothetical protein
MSADVTAREASELAKQGANSDAGKKAVRTLCNRYFTLYYCHYEVMHTDHIHVLY